MEIYDYVVMAFGQLGDGTDIVNRLTPVDP